MGDEPRTTTPRQLYEKYASAVAYVAVERSDGVQSVGSAFHVGGGVFLTARHVVENRRIVEIATTTMRYIPDPSSNVRHEREGPVRQVWPGVARLRSGPHFHPDAAVDVAAIVVEGIDPAVIPLGTHLDDWIEDEGFVLGEVLTMGYPPIPLSRRPVLLASRGEINAVVDSYVGRHPHFVLSSMARGGFSGGPCLTQWDYALGLTTSSLVHGDHPEQLGYMAVISVEPLRVCLEHHGILPVEQRKALSDDGSGR